jgi:hypothetical protein
VAPSKSLNAVPELPETGRAAEACHTYAVVAQRRVITAQGADLVGASYKVGKDRTRPYDGNTI